MDVLSGDAQSGVVGVELPQALVVRVIDSTGAPIAGQIVNFRVVSGGGGTFAGAAISDAQGRAAERWTLGTAATDSQRIEARAVDPSSGSPLVFATFRANAVPGTVASVARLSPDSQVAIAGNPVPVSPAVRTRDKYGNPASGVPVSFRVTGGGGSISDSLVLSDSTGLARIAQWKLGPAAGANTVSATANGLAPTVFIATGTATPASPTIALSDNSLLFTVIAGDTASAAQSVGITNVGRGTLSGLTGTFSYASSQATGWLEGYFTSTSAPASGVIRVVPGRLTAGTYGATLEIRAPGATNSGQLISITMVVRSATPTGNDICSTIAGASVVAYDGVFLGTLTNKYDSNSIFNDYGNYGGKYSAKSIFNEYGNYGGQYANYSPFNPYTSKPPILSLRGTALMYLTVNATLTPRFDPRNLSSCSFP